MSSVADGLPLNKRLPAVIAISLAIAVLAFFLGVYPQPLLTLVQHAVLGV